MTNGMTTIDMVIEYMVSSLGLRKEVAESLLDRHKEVMHPASIASSIVEMEKRNLEESFLPPQYYVDDYEANLDDFEEEEEQLENIVDEGDFDLDDDDDDFDEDDDDNYELDDDEEED